MGFKITKDYLGEEFSVIDDETGTIGPRDIWDDTVQRLDKGEGTPFKMYDDDGILYYDGLYIEDERENTEYHEWDQFQPLDAFGTPNAGAVRIDYLNAETGIWETL